MAINDFDSDWQINWQEKLIRRQSGALSKKYDLSDFWRWIRKEEASFESGMAYPHILDTDGMGSSYGVPRKIRLANGYRIEESSLGFLVGGDSILLDESNNVLVVDRLSKTNWWENSWVQGGLILAAIIGIFLAL